MRERDAFGMALKRLRERLRDGEYAPGAPLVILELVEELQISATPVREALSRLAGEGLVEDRRGWGFCAWRLNREELEELYLLHGLHLQLMQAAGARLDLDPERGLALDGSADPQALRAATEALFETLARSSGRTAARLNLQHLADRLGFARLAEARVFDDVGEELLALQAALQQGDAERKLTAYHERRAAAAGQILRQMTKTT